MHLSSVLSLLLAATASVSADRPNPPSVTVRQCPTKATVKFDKTVPDRKSFPRTSVDICYNGDSIELTFKAKDEKHFHFDPKQKTNDDIWQYEVMEAFIAVGENDPQTYLEFEVNPNNVTYQAFIYNPSKIRAEYDAFDHFFINNPIADGLTASTKLNRKAHTWESKVKIPLGLFNVDTPQNTKWRMNFFRTVTSPATFPKQELGAWSSPNKASFHITPYFGHVRFV